MALVSYPGVFIPGKITWPDPPNYVPSIAEAIHLRYLAPQNLPILCQLMEKEVFAVVSGNGIPSYPCYNHWAVKPGEEAVVN